VPPARVESLESRTLLTGIAFARAMTFPTGHFPTAIEVADLNGDGKLDVVTANFGDGTIQWFAGHGDGTFSPAATIPVGNGPDSIAIADLNGDGHPDIVVANSGAAPFDTATPNGNTLSILFGNGDGTFQPRVDIPTPALPQDVAVADMNGDGHPDLLTANRTDNSISEWLNNGDGTFTFDPAGHVPMVFRPSALAVGDVNLDGKPDIAVANNGSNRVTVLLGNGDGSFQTGVNYVTPQYPRDIAIADVTGDGLPDIVTANFTSTVSYLVGKGNGVFGPLAAFGAGNAPFALAVHDMNGDGRPDVVVAVQNDNTVNVLLKSRVNGGFQPISIFATHGGGPTAVAVGDVNGDGRPDMLAANFNFDTFSVLLNTLAATQTTLVSSQTVAPSGTAVQFTAVVRPTDPTVPHIPQGYVQFYDGPTALGASLIRTDGTAAFVTSRLAQGFHAITAVYLGNNFFGGNTSAQVTQLIQPPLTNQVLVVPTIHAVSVPAAGLKVGVSSGVASVFIQNQGDQTASGDVQLRLLLSADDTASADDTPLDQTLGTLRLRLAARHSVTVSTHFTVPTGVAPGTYFLLAQLLPVSGFTPEQVSPNASVWVSKITVTA
jgi:hypothetical protein